MKLPSCKIYDLVVLSGVFALVFCTVAGLVMDFVLTWRGMQMSETMSRASAAALGALIVIVTNANQRRNHDVHGETEKNGDAQA
jgi:hypothetical protein